MRIWIYHPTSEIPGELLERLSANAADATLEGRRLAEVLRTKPAGKRAALVTDLGGGSSPPSRHWWGARDEAQARAVLREGKLPGALAETVSFMDRVWDAYRFHSGPPLDFLAANVEVRPDRWFPHWPAGFGWHQVKAARDAAGLDDAAATESIACWAAKQQAECVRASLVAPYRAAFGGSRTTVIVNISACDWAEPHTDPNGWRFHDCAPDGVSSPMLYLNDAAQFEAKTIPNILAHNVAAFRRVKRPVVPTLGDIGFGGDGKARKDTRVGGEERSAWETLARLMMAEGPTDLVLWWNKPPFGPEPSADEMRFMGRVLREGAGR